MLSVLDMSVWIEQVNFRESKASKKTIETVEKSGPVRCFKNIV